MKPHSWAHNATVALVSAHLFFGCAEPSGPARPSPAELLVAPAEVQLRAGSTQQLAAQSNDKGGDPIGGVAIEFTSQDAALIHVSEAGLVSSVGPSGEAVVLVRSGAQEARIPVRVRPGPPTTIRSAAPDSQLSGVVKATLERPVEVVVTDAFENPVPGARVSFKPVAEGGVVDPVDALSGTAGRARTLWTLGPVAGEQQLTVSTDAASMQVAARAIPGPASTISLAGQLPLTAPGNTEVQLRARLTDAFGNGIPEQPVVWSVISSGGRVGPTTSQTDGSGIAQSTWRLGSEPGAQRAKATHGALTVEPTVAAVLGPPAKVLIERSEPQKSKRGISSFPVVVSVADVHGNPLAGVAVTLTPTPPTDRVEPRAPKTDTNGKATALWTPKRGEAEPRLEAHVDGLAGVSIDAFEPPPAAAAPAEAPPSQAPPSQAPAASPPTGPAEKSPAQPDATSTK